MIAGNYQRDILWTLDPGAGRVVKLRRPVGHHYTVRLQAHT